MALDLKALSPKELQALIAGAHAQMQEAHTNQVRTVREKIDSLLKSAGLTINEVYPTRGGKKSSGKKGVVAPKYRNPENGETWSGRGRQPVWFAKALKKSGVTAESLLIRDAVAKKAAPAKKKAPVKRAKKAPIKKA
ncbi:MAG: H-NS histone family protein [Proteobacteria bacterium]|nr:H-NS histone family protein [Pseudomonadota bacterium]